MPTALIQDNAVISAWDSFPPIDKKLPNGAAIAGSWAYVVYPVIFDDGSMLVEASYADEQQPGYAATGFDLAGSSINAGPPVTVSLKRTWEAIPVEVPPEITRKQALKALLIDGGISDPEAAITAAINAIQDPTQQKIMRWSFDANDWLVSDLVANAGLLGLTADQVNAFAIKAATY